MLDSQDVVSELEPMEPVAVRGVVHAVTDMTADDTVAAGVDPSACHDVKVRLRVLLRKYSSDVSKQALGRSS